jgi:hypothetical protein
MHTLSRRTSTRRGLPTLFGLALLALAAGADPPSLAQEQVSPADSKAYYEAMLDAQAEATQKKVCRDLLAVVREKDPVNSKKLHNGTIRWEPVSGSNRVLVATFMSRQSYERYYKSNLDQHLPTYTLTKCLWVTVVPELKNYFVGKECPPTKKRVVKALGLNPAKPYEVVLEMYVEPDALFRPAPDPEATDHEATTSAPEPEGSWSFQNDSNPFLAFNPSATYADYQGATPMTFREWFAWNATGSYKMPDPQDVSTWGAPWTRLGYTYDWGKTGGNHEGVSEFILRIDPAVSGGELTVTLVRAVDVATTGWKGYFRCDAQAYGSEAAQEVLEDGNAEP